MIREHLDQYTALPARTGRLFPSLNGGRSTTSTFPPQRHSTLTMSSAYNDDRLDTRGLILKRRSEVRPGEIIVAPAPRNSQQLIRRASSLDRYDDRGTGGRGRNMAMQQYRDPRDRDASDSEASVPPRSRNRHRSQGASNSNSKSKSKPKSGGKGQSSSASSSSDLCSSTEDEKRIKKMKRKKYITYGLAGVATIHAAATLKSSFDHRKQRKVEVEEGKISPEEAQKRNEQGKWQDAAAVGLSALGLYQVWNETKECWELRKEHLELEEGREERHKKREERRRRQKS